MMHPGFHPTFVYMPIEAAHQTERTSSSPRRSFFEMSPDERARRALDLLRRLKQELEASRKAYVETYRWRERVVSYSKAVGWFFTLRWWKFFGNDPMFSQEAHAKGNGKFLGFFDRAKLGDARSTYEAALGAYAAQVRIVKGSDAAAERAFRIEHARTILSQRENALFYTMRKIAPKVASVIRKHPRAALAGAAVLLPAVILALAPIIKTVTLVAGAKALAAGLGTRFFAGKALYHFRKPKFSGKRTEAQLFEEGALLADSQQAGRILGIIAGAWTGLHARLFEADDIAHGLGLHSQNETVASTMQDHLVAAIEAKRGAPFHLPMEGPVHDTVEAAWSDTPDAIGELQRIYHVTPTPGDHDLLASLADVQARLQGLENGTHVLTNTPANNALVAEGVARLKHARLIVHATLQADRVPAGSPAAGLLHEAAANVGPDNHALKEWIRAFDNAEFDAKLLLGEQHDGSVRGIVRLVHEYLFGDQPLSAGQAQAATPPVPGVRSLRELALPLRPGEVTAANFMETQALAERYLKQINYLLEQYPRVIGPDQDLQALKSLKITYEDFLQRLAELKPDFARLDAIASHADTSARFEGDRLGEALLMDRFANASPERVAHGLSFIDTAGAKLGAVHPGTIWIKGKGIVPIDSVLRFKDTAGTELFPEIGGSVYRFLNTLPPHLQSLLRINEGWELTRAHKVGLQMEGMSIDFSFAPDLHDSSPLQTVEQIAEALHAGNPADRSISIDFEIDDPARHALLVKGVTDYLIDSLGLSPRAASRLVEAHLKLLPKGWIDGEHFSFYDHSGPSKFMQQAHRGGLTS